MRQRLLFLCLLVVNVASLCNAAGPALAIAGRWEGAVQIPGSPLRVVVDLAQQEGAWVGSATVPGFAVKGAPLVGVAVKGNDVEFGFQRALGAATFKGQLEADGTLNGEFTQSGNKAPFQLKRIGDAEVELPKVGMPVAKDFQGEWRGSYQFVTMKLNVILKLNGGDPRKPGEFVVVDWGNTSFPIDLWTTEGNRVNFVAEAGGITYEGELHKDTSEIVGTLRQSVIEQPLTLKRSVTN